MIKKKYINHYAFVSDNNLKEIRKRLGLSLEEVSDLLQHDSEYVLSAWELGAHVPGLIGLLKLSIIYNVPINEFYPKVLNSVKKELKFK